MIFGQVISRKIQDYSIILRFEVSIMATWLLHPVNRSLCFEHQQCYSFNVSWLTTCDFNERALNGHHRPTVELFKGKRPMLDIELFVSVWIVCLRKFGQLAKTQLTHDSAKDISLWIALVLYGLYNLTIRSFGNQEVEKFLHIFRARRTM